MKKVNIIFWSGTGNTEEMATLIGEGVIEAGGELVVKSVGNASKEDVIKGDIIIFGSPAMGAEVIEEDEMDPFIESIKDKIDGKTVGLFGSYDWGDGQWMRDWEERMDSYGAKVFKDSCIVQNQPDSEGKNNCKDFGKNIVGA